MNKGPSLLVRFTIYPIVALVVLALVVFVVYSAAGYQISYKDGKFVTTETGIIIINTKPGDAEVYLDGELYKKKTPSFALFDLKINRIMIGDHNLKISKNGYEVWDGTVNVKPGLVSWVNYILLLPQERETESYSISGEIKGSITSDDNQRELLYSYDEKEKVNLITEVNTTNKELKKLYEFLSTDKSEYNLISFSHDKERFLVKKTLGKKVSYIVYETKENGNNWNLSTLFDLGPDKILFSPHNHDKLYALKNSNIYELDYSLKMQSSVLANNVTSIYYDPANILYIQESDENHALWSLSSSNEKKNIIKALPASKQYKVSYLAKYGDYLVLAIDEKDLIIYSNGKKNPTLETISSDVSSYVLSSSENKISYIKDDSLKVYDIDDKEYFDVVNNKKIYQYSWLYNDGNLLYLDENNVLSMVNYNGDYNNQIIKVDKSLPFITTPNSPHVFFGILKEGSVIFSSFTFNL